MIAEQVHQLVHGYVHGHSLLAASTQLERQDADLVARLSDLSGTLGPNLEADAYLSLYPLPSRNYYAVAKTWPDPTAPRAGCVLTHTLLVPPEAWASDPHPKRFAGLLRRPDRTTLTNFQTPLRFGDKDSQVDVASAVESFALSFVQKYFGEGLSPLVWFGAMNADAAAWQVVTSLWPKLRSTFACCTYALQPRTLEDRPFDLAFAPTAAFARFGEYPREHVIDSRTSPELGPNDSWLRDLMDQVFGRGISDSIWALTRDLEGEPTAIRRVFFYADLRNRAANSPTAALGGLDVLETLARRPDACVDEKRGLASVAIRDIEAVSPPASLELLYLLAERLHKPAFASVRDAATTVRHSVRTAIIAAPVEALDLAAALTERQPESSPESFVAGVCDGVLNVLNHKPEAVSVFLEHPALGDRLVRDCAGLAEAALKARSPANRRRVVEMVVGWCRSQRSDRVRSALRAEILPVLETGEDAALIDELLCDVPTSEVPLVCEIVTRVDAFDDDVLINMIASALGDSGRNEVRRWALSHAWSSRRVARLVASSYSQDAQGLQELMADYASDVPRQQSLLVAAIEKAATYSLPAWLEQSLAEEPGIWEVLLSSPSTEPIRQLVGRIVRRLRRSAIVRIKDAIVVIGRFVAQYGDDTICEQAIRQLWSNFLAGEVYEATLGDWMDAQWVREWLERAPRGALRSEFANALKRNRSAWTQAWRVLALLPRAASITNPALVHDAVGALLQQPDPWEPQVSQSWLATLKPIAYGETIQVDLCAQALGFALDHRHWPVDDVVAESFFAVHDAAMKDEPRQRPFFIFWTVTDWDKAKELRRSIVEAFIYGSWRPSRFILAAREPWLLRKLCKRMLRQHRGDYFLEAAYRELLSRPDYCSPNLMAALREILRAPGYREDWD